MPMYEPNSCSKLEVRIDAVVVENAVTKFRRRNISLALVEQAGSKRPIADRYRHIPANAEASDCILFLKCSTWSAGAYSVVGFLQPKQSKRKCFMACELNTRPHSLI